MRCFRSLSGESPPFRPCQSPPLCPSWLRPGREFQRGIHWGSFLCYKFWRFRNQDVLFAAFVKRVVLHTPLRKPSSWFPYMLLSLSFPPNQIYRKMKRFTQVKMRGCKLCAFHCHCALEPVVGHRAVEREVVAILFLLNCLDPARIPGPVDVQTVAGNLLKHVACFLLIDVHGRVKQRVEFHRETKQVFKEWSAAKGVVVQGWIFPVRPSPVACCCLRLCFSFGASLRFCFGLWLRFGLWLPALVLALVCCSFLCLCFLPLFAVVGGRVLQVRCA